jgi:hypothetical protein
VKGLSVFLQADFWQVMDSDNKDRISSSGWEIAYNKPQTINIAIGSFYSLYSYDYFKNTDEKTDVDTFYSDLRYYIQPGLYLDARYQLDRYDIDDHRFIATIGLEM